MTIKKVRGQRRQFRVVQDGQDNVLPMSFHHGRQFDCSKPLTAALSEVYSFGFIDGAESVHLVKTSTGFAFRAFDGESFYTFSDIGGGSFGLKDGERVTITWESPEGTVSRTYEDD